MDSKDQLREGSDYHVHFDPMTYIDDYYSKIKGFMSIESTLESLHKIYATGRYNIGSKIALHLSLQNPAHYILMLVHAICKNVISNLYINVILMSYNASDILRFTLICLERINNLSKRLIHVLAYVICICTERVRE